MAFLAQFVDSIAASPTVRLSLQSLPTWRVHIDGTEFPPPPLRRAVVQTLLTDGAIIPSSAYDLRTLRLVLSVFGTADQVATQLQDLAQELDRPRNFFMWQQETTNPIFFRTFRTSADSITDLGMVDGTRKLISVEIPAEPFAYGPLETPISGATLNRDPAAATNPTYVDVTGVKGDVETPALIKFTDSAVGQRAIFAMRRGRTTNVPYLFQAEAMTQGTDTATQVNDANFSGASNNYSRVTPGTTSMVTRLSLTDIGTSSADLRGRYHVWLRYRKNTSGDGWSIRLQWGSTTAAVTTNTTFVTPATTNICKADLGEIQIPRGWDTVYDGRSGVELPASDAFALNVQAQRVSGSGTLDLDFLQLVPADDRYASFVIAERASDHWWLDAEDNSASNRTAADNVASITSPTVTGNLPMLSPNVTNRVYMLDNTASGASTLLNSQTVSVAYYPRYLYVRPAST